MVILKKMSFTDEDFFEENHFYKRHKMLRGNSNLLICFNFSKDYLNKQDKITFMYYLRRKLMLKMRKNIWIIMH